MMEIPSNYLSQCASSGVTASAWTRKVEEENPEEMRNTILRGILSEFKKHNQLQREAVYLMKMKDTGVQIIPLKEMQEEE